MPSRRATSFSWPTRPRESFRIRRASRGPNCESFYRWDAVIAVLADDALKTQAVVKLVMAQPGVSSQLIDNLNASIHVRALLTDMFLLDELLGSG